MNRIFLIAMALVVLSTAGVAFGQDPGLGSGQSGDPWNAVPHDSYHPAHVIELGRRDLRRPVPGRGFRQAPIGSLRRFPASEFHGLRWRK